MEKPDQTLLGAGEESNARIADRKRAIATTTGLCCTLELCTFAPGHGHRVCWVLLNGDFAVATAFQSALGFVHVKNAMRI